MRLNNIKAVRYGREKKNKSEEERKDIIHRIYLGDRQVWEEQELDDIEDITEAGAVGTIWHIVKDFNLANVTAATSIIGTVSWGDNETEGWRSGQTYSHTYFAEGDYTIYFNSDSYTAKATIGQIKDYSLQTSINNTLIGVIFGIIPFCEHRLNDENKGVFEDVTTIETVIVPEGIKEIPKRVLYNTGFTQLTLPKTLEKIEDYSFVSNNVTSITVLSKDVVFGEKSLCYGTNDNVITNIEFKCYEDSTAASYARSIGIEPIILTE